MVEGYTASMEKPITPALVEKIIELGRMLLAFGRVERATHHEDGVTKETDTTHTVMLGIMASAFATEFAPHLDTGKIAQFALVHDLVEVYAGDTVTFGLYAKDTEKDGREAEALARIKKEYDAVFPWIGNTIEEYEKREVPEARFVKVFDKILPKIVHILNKGVTVRELGHTTESMTKFHAYQHKNILESYGFDQSEALELLAAISVEAHVRIFE